jgi:hypothetical protein
MTQNKSKLELASLDLFNDVMSSGGFSVTPDLARPTTGYMVSLTGYETVVPLSVINDRIVTDIMYTYDAIVRDLQLTCGNVLYVGVWLDGDTNKVYFDISENVLDLETALAIGKARRQISIFDLVTFYRINIQY